MLNKKDNKDKENSKDFNQNHNKYAIIIDNIQLKLGLKDKKDVVNVLKTKLQYIKVNNPIRYMELMGQPKQTLLNC